MIHSANDNYCFINVYMPCFLQDNSELYMECMANLSAINEEHATCNFNI